MVRVLVESDGKHMCVGKGCSGSAKCIRGGPSQAAERLQAQHVVFALVLLSCRLRAHLSREDGLQPTVRGTGRVGWEGAGLGRTLMCRVGSSRVCSLGCFEPVHVRHLCRHWDSLGSLAGQLAVKQSEGGSVAPSLPARHSPQRD